MSGVPMKIFTPTAADQALHLDICALINRHLTPDTPDRFLAIAAQVVGQALALQDQRKMTKEMAFEIILTNIEMGNQAVISQLMNSTGGTA